MKDDNCSVLPNLSSAGKALDGRVMGGDWVAGRMPGKMGLHFRGPGSGDRVELPNPDRFEFPGAFSIVAWFELDEPQKFMSLLTIASKGDSSWRVLQNEHGMLRFDTCNGSVPYQKSGYWQCMDGPTKLENNRWYFVAVVYEPLGDIVKKRLYLNGHLEIEWKIPPIRQRNKNAAWIGANNDFVGVREWLGNIDEIAFFSRVLSASEITTMFQAGNSESEARQ
jgi:hypothetical protein